MINLHKMLKILLFLSFANTFVYAIEIKDISQAVDVAGKQRMYTQRLLKDYVMVGMKNNFDNPKEDLIKISTNFEEHLNSLEKFTTDPDVKKSLNISTELWKDIKKELLETPTKESAKKLQTALEKLLKSSDDSTKLFAKLTGKTSGDIINIAGRQRMLSQRMASLYMLKVWGIEDGNFKQKMKESMALFKTSLKRLNDYEKNTPEITTLLKKVKRNFMFFEMMNKSKSKFIPSLIYKKSNDILKDMNTVTGLYVTLKTI